MEDFSARLVELSTLKAPGVSGSRIRKLVELAMAHVGEADKVAAELLEQTEKAPASHKLGYLYIFDAIARAWHDEAKKSSEANGYTAAHAELAGIFERILQAAKPRGQIDDVHEKMRKLLEIWIRAGTFDVELVNQAREAYFVGPHTLTPPGSPPSNFGGIDASVVAAKPASPPASSRATPPPKEAPSAASILETLANLAKTNTGAAAAPQAAPTGPAVSSTSEVPGSALLQQLLSQTGGIPTGPAAAPERRGHGRDRSPPRGYGRDRSRSPDSQRRGERADRRGGASPRDVPIDPELVPRNSIRVFSRTLFLGGIPPDMDEQGISRTLGEFAKPQSIIFQREKRQAFVKAFSRADAEKIRDGLDDRYRHAGGELRARWGVGFGPRQCADYQKGVSIIPLDVLTDADKRWAVSARHGGTGGAPLQPGQVLEEPDIEIGSGVSSKSMSSRQVPQMRPNGFFGNGGRPDGMGGMPGMPGMSMPGMPMPGMPMPGMPGFPGMPGMPGVPDMAAMGNMPMPFPMMGMMPPGMDMSQFFAQQQQQQQQQPQQPAQDNQKGQS